MASLQYLYGLIEKESIMTVLVALENTCGQQPSCAALEGLLQASFGRFPQSIAHSFALEIRHGRTASNF